MNAISSSDQVASVRVSPVLGIASVIFEIFFKKRNLILSESVTSCVVNDGCSHMHYLQ